MDRMTMNDAMDEVFNRRHAPRGMDDSDRNIMSELRHEPCFAHCETCGACIEATDAFSIEDGTYNYFCEDC